MLSLEAFTMEGQGSPQLFQTGESYNRNPLVNYQHPHDFLMGLEETDPSNLKVHIRGNVQNLGAEVHRGFPAILAGTDGEPMPFTLGSGRLELAEAILRHPLAARVMVNRIWMHHFGRGIVASTNNFGAMGDPPSHSDLLDWLACEFISAHPRQFGHQPILSLSFDKQPASGEISPGSAAPQVVGVSAQLVSVESGESKDAAARTCDPGLRQQRGKPFAKAFERAKPRQLSGYHALVRIAPSVIMCMIVR